MEINDHEAGEKSAGERNKTRNKYSLVAITDTALKKVTLEGKVNTIELWINSDTSNR